MRKEIRAELQRVKEERDTLQKILLNEVEINHSLRAEVEKLKQENSYIRLERTHGIDLKYGAPVILDYEAMEKEMRDGKAEVEKLRAALQNAVGTFRSYARIHRAKNPPDLAKAEANDAMADELNDALSPQPEPPKEQPSIESKV